MNAITKRETAVMALDEDSLMRVLQSSLYPGAAPESIKMVIGYCQAAGLDPMQKPVHIVPMWDSRAKQMRDVVMPGVNLYRTQAARSGQFAGMSEPEFGPDVTETIGGQRITYPQWCRVTVKRLMANGTVAEFTAREFWTENYAIKGGPEKSVAPNAMWTKRPRGQIAKCAAAQALRIAFPEIASAHTADEMEGKTINEDLAADHRTAARDEWIAKVAECKTLQELGVLAAGKGPAVTALQKAKDTEGYRLFVQAVQERGAALKAAVAPAVPPPQKEPAPPPSVPVDDTFVAEMDAAGGAQ